MQGDTATIRGTAATKAAAMLTVARTKLQLEPGHSAAVKLGRSLALQAFTKLIAGCNAWATFQYTQAGALTASTDFTAGRLLLLSALRQLDVTMHVFTLG